MIRARLIAPALLAGLVAGTASGPAVAGSTTINDLAGDNVAYESESADYGDLTTIKVRHSPKTVKITVAGNGGDGLEIYLDTRAKRPGPEFLVSWESYLSEVFLSTTTGDWEVAKANLKCSGARLADTAGSTTFVIPRKCLAKKGKKPQRVRANAEAINFYDSVARDEAPALHTFGGWARTG